MVGVCVCMYVCMYVCMLVGTVLGFFVAGEWWSHLLAQFGAAEDFSSAALQVYQFIIEGGGRTKV